MAFKKVSCVSMACVALITLIAVLSTFTTEAAVFYQPNALHPEQPGKCFDQITRRAMLPNKEYKPKGICAVFTCDIEDKSISVFTCPSIDMPGCEELPPNPFASYPKCCSQFKCTDSKTGKTFVASL